MAYRKNHAGRRLAVEGSAARAPEPEYAERERYLPGTRQFHETETVSRPHAAKRETGAISPLAVVGFSAVIAMTMMLLHANVQSMQLDVQMSELESQLSELQKQNAVLTSSYESIYDSATIDSAVDGTMVRASQDHYIYVDLSKQDSVTVYTGDNWVGQALQSVENVAANIIEYFR